MIRVLSIYFNTLLLNIQKVSYRFGDFTFVDCDNSLIFGLVDFRPSSLFLIANDENTRAV